MENRFLNKKTVNNRLVLSDSDRYIKWIPIELAAAEISSEFDEGKLIKYIVEKGLIKSIDEINIYFQIGKVIRWNVYLIENPVNNNMEKELVLELSTWCIDELKDRYFEDSNPC